MRAICYLRVSTDKQSESGLGLEAQREMCDEWAVENGADDVLYFVDEGVSGGKAPDERDGLIAAINALDEGDVLLAAKRDRFARGMGSMGVVERLVDKAGARLVSASGEGTQSDDPLSGMLEARITDLFAEYERAMASVRTKAALEAKAQRGERTGQVPFGKQLADDGQTLLDDPAEQKVIEIVGELRARGESYRSIADYLNDETEHTNKAGNDFGPKSVSRIADKADVDEYEQDVDDEPERGDETNTADDSAETNDEQSHEGGRAPFGKRYNDDGDLVDDPAEQHALELVAALRDRGESYRSIAEYLNDETPYTNRAGNTFGPKSVSRLHDKATA
jgi:DNA invertase Pin-like site-specific DNA recombinase